MREAFRTKGEGSSGCKRGGGEGKGRVSVLKNEVNKAGVPLNRNERSADSYVIFLPPIYLQNALVHSKKGPKRNR